MKIMPLPETTKKVKRFFFSKLSKQTVILLFVFGLLFSLVPLKTAQAGIAEWIAERLFQYAVTTSGAFVPIIIFLVLTDFFLGGITAFVSLLLFVMMKISFAITLVPKAGGTDAVSVGFAFTRDLANIGFVLVLAWVAFATILRIRTYQLKSILPKLLIIAVLVNFIPVITGFIVDIANIVTVIFQDKALGAVDQWLGRFGATSWISNPGGFLEGLKELFSNPTVYLIVKPIGNIVVNFFSIFIFLFYALIFIVRVVAIWVLIILAPLCWLGYIIPAGKKWWNFWWNQFILWTIIGIPILFFLYLAGYLLQYPMPCTATELPGLWSSLFVQVPADLLCKFLPYLVSIIILWIGMGISLSLAPRGSKGIIGGLKKVAKWGAVTAGTVAGVAAARRAGPLAQRLAEGLRDPAKAFQGISVKQAKGLGKIGALASKGGWGVARGLNWTTRGVGTGLIASGLEWGAGEAGSWAAQSQQKKIGAAKGAIANLKKEDQLKSLVGSLELATATRGWAPESIEKVVGKIEAIDDKHNLAWVLNHMTPKQLSDIFKFTAKNSPDKLKDLAKFRQDLIEDKTLGPILTSSMVSDGLQDKDVGALVSLMTNQEITELKAGRITKDELVKKAGYKKMVDSLSGADIDEGLTEETLNRPEFQEMAVRFMSREKLRRLIDHAPPGYVDKLWSMIHTVGVEKMAKSNASLLRLPYTPGGTELGLKELEAAPGIPLTIAQVNQLIRTAQAAHPIRSQADVDAVIKAIP